MDRIAVSGPTDFRIELIVDSDFRSICITHDSSATNGMQVYEYIGQIVPYALLNKKNIVFHGVLLEHKGKTFIIAADSGVGKTTHARLWRDTENALILNGNLAAVCKSGDRWYGY